jgi:hypothetical protein
MFLPYCQRPCLVDNIDTINKNSLISVDTGKDVVLQINIRKSKYVFVSHHQNAGQNRDL